MNFPRFPYFPRFPLFRMHKLQSCRVSENTHPIILLVIVENGHTHSVCLLPSRFFDFSISPLTGLLYFAKSDILRDLRNFCILWNFSEKFLYFAKFFYAFRRWSNINCEIEVIICEIAVIICEIDVRVLLFKVRCGVRCWIESGVLSPEVFWKFLLKTVPSYIS